MAHTTRQRSIAAFVATALLALAALGLIQAGNGDAATHGVASKRALTVKERRFHDGMRKLWEDHITWTRLAIVSFAAGLPDLAPTEQRLLQNQVAIGDAVKPFYGKKAGNQLTKLLKVHITTAVAILSAAKSGDQAGLAKAKADWYANANDIAAFLHKANPRHWPLGALKHAMKKHLDQTLKEAVDRLGGNFQADIRDYDAVHRHILEMADVLSSGIIAQFPNRFH